MSATPLSPAILERRVLLVVFLTVFLDMIGFGLVLPLLPFYVEDMGGSAQTVGLILSCFAITQLLATPVMGSLSDKYGRRRIILISLAGNAVSMLVFALATWIALLPLVFFSRILAGATAGNLSACQAAVADVTAPENRARGMGLVGAGIGLGMVVGPGLGSFTSHFGTWAPPVVAAVMVTLDFFLAAVLMPETRNMGEAKVRSSASSGTEGAASPSASAPRASMWKKAFSSRPLLLVMAINFLAFMTLSNLQVSFALLTRARLGWGAKEVGYMYVLFGVMALVVQGGLIGRLVRRFGELKLVAVGTVLTGTGMAAIAWAPTAALILAAAGVFAIGSGIINPVVGSLASMFAGEEDRGGVLGLTQSAGGLARAVGPTLSGLLFDLVGPRAPFIGGSLYSLLNLGVALYLASTVKKSRAAAASASVSASA